MTRFKLFRRVVLVCFFFSFFSFSMLSGLAGLAWSQNIVTNNTHGTFELQLQPNGTVVSHPLFGDAFPNLTPPQRTQPSPQPNQQPSQQEAGIAGQSQPAPIVVTTPTVCQCNCLGSSPASAPSGSPGGAAGIAAQAPEPPAWYDGDNGAPYNPSNPTGSLGG